MSPLVSVVVPAHNARATLERALGSLAAQDGDWEAIVVDDGSTDDTQLLARAHADADARLTVVSRTQGGPSAARNTALERATGRWVLFLDSDDELAPGGLRALLDGAERAPAAKWLWGGWERITPSGAVDTFPARHLEDAASLLARTCPFAIHSVLVERALVDAVGGFDEALRTCEDWELWQRVARAAGGPVPVEATVARYRVRALSQSFDTTAMLNDGLVVIDRGHRPPVSPEGHESARVAYAAYAAGIAIGAGAAVPDLAALGREAAPHVDPAAVADMLFGAVPFGALSPRARWADLADRAADGLETLLGDLERLTGTPLLARRSLRQLQRLVAGTAAPGPAFNLAGARIVDLDLGTTIPEQVPTHGAERLHVRGMLDGAVLGVAEVGVGARDQVAGELLLDAVLEPAAWPLLERLIVEPLGDQLTSGPDGTVRRGRAIVGQITTDAPERRDLLAAAAWVLFLQELWGAPALHGGNFYAHVPPEAQATPPAGEDIIVEVSAPLPRGLARRAVCTIQVTVGGLPLDRFAIARGKRPLTAARLRSAICSRGGIELAHLAARAALMVPARPGESLRGRLQRAAALSPPACAPPTLTDGAVAGVAWPRVVAPFLTGGEGLVVLGRVPGELPTPGTGRVALVPPGAESTLVAAAVAEGRPRAVLGAGGALLCAPGVAWAPGAPGAAVVPRALELRSAARVGAARFESLFASGEDPWRYASGYETRKYEQTLELLPAHVESLLEIACAEGHFTVQVADRAARVVATDVSQVALERARARCAHLPSVSFRHEDLFAGEISGRWDAIVCSEVLYYLRDRAALDRVARSIADALVPGGVLVTAHAHLLVDDPTMPGFDWGEAFGALGIQAGLRDTGMLALEAEIVTPMYRVQRWRRHANGRRYGALRRRLPARVDRRRAEASSDLPASALARFHPEGGRPEAAGDGEPQLPVLMYHRVAPNGTAAGRRWRVTPAELDAQLGFLREAGFTTITPREWRDFRALGQPLPAQPLLLTFDDGFADFAEHAMPVLTRHGMTATLFIVTACVGETNAWDGDLDPAPLLDWPKLRELRGRGFTIGAHTRTHPPLTGLTDSRAMEELAGCRLDILEQLGEPPVAFAYPYGDLADGVRRLSAAAGYDLAFSCAHGRASRESDLLALPRIEVRGGMSPAELAREVAAW